MTKTLEPSSNPNIIIVHEDNNPNLNTSPMLLNGTNYVVWSKEASMYLYSRSKMGFVAGKKPAPAPDNPASGDNLVRSLLINSVEPWLVEGMYFRTTAEEMWKAHTEIYGEKIILQRFMNLKKAYGNTMELLEACGMN